MYRLLIADDEKIILEGIVNGINWGSLNVKEVQTAVDGEQFIKNAEIFIPDIAIVDIRMPKIDGLEAIRYLAPLHSNCKFIVLTAFEDFRYAKQAISLGVVEYITKPVLPQEIILAVKKAIHLLENKSYSSSLTDNVGESKLDRLLKFLQINVESNISLEDAADFMDMNASYFSRLFKESTGLTPLEYRKFGKE